MMNETKKHAIRCCARAMLEHKEKAKNANYYSEWSYHSRKYAEGMKMLKDKYGYELEGERWQAIKSIKKGK